MSDVKSLLEQATPLPWPDPEGTVGMVTYSFGPDAALTVHAVNHLPDYEAAVDALERLLNFRNRESQDRTQDELSYIEYEAEEALRRLRGEPS